MESTILIRYGELFLKGKNKNYFEKVLINNIREKLNLFNARVVKISGRYFVCDYNESDEFQIIETLSKIFGIHSVSPAKMFDTSVENITNYVKILNIENCTFRVSVKRADKSFPINSSEFGAQMGGVILKNCKKK